MYNFYILKDGWKYGIIASRLIPYFASRLLLLVNNMAAEFFSYWQYVFWQKKLSMMIWCLTFDLHWLARYSSESSWCQSVGWSVWGDVLMGVTELLAYDDGAPSWYQPYVLLVKKVTELLACDGAPSLGYDMEGMFLIVRGIAHNKFVASKVNNERKLPGHSCVYTMELQQICSAKDVLLHPSSCQWCRHLKEYLHTGCSRRRPQPFSSIR